MQKLNTLIVIAQFSFSLVKIAARTEEPTTTYKEQHVDGDDEDDDLFPLDRCRFNPRIAHSPAGCCMLVG